MRFKIILKSKDTIKTFVLAVQMLSKHSDRLIFIAAEDMLTIMVERPTVWVDFYIHNFAEFYSFNGYIEPDFELDYIYFDVKTINALLLESLITSEIDYAELKLTKKIQNAPFLKVYTNSEQGKGSLIFEIPVIIIPYTQWSTVNLPRKITFDSSCVTPKYTIFRKYVDIYKHFKTLKFCIKPDCIRLEAEDVESNVMTNFDYINGYDENGDPITKPSFANVDSKRLSMYIHSINILHLAKLDIRCHIKHKKYLKIDFQNADGSIVYNTILENIKNDNDNESNDAQNINPE